MGFEGLNNNQKQSNITKINEYVMIADEYNSIEELNNIWVKYILQPYDKQCKSDEDCKIKYGKSLREQYECLYKDLSNRIYIDPINESTSSDKGDYVKNINFNINSLNDLPMLTPDMMNDYKNYYSKSNNNAWQESYQLLSLGCLSEDYFELNKERINSLTELYRQYPFKDDETKQKVLDLGWNPEVDFSTSNRIKATENTRLRLNNSLNINELFDATGLFNENYMFSNDNLYINYDKFTSGKSNILLITGLSGSGKSTLGKEISDKFDAEYVELDTLCFLGTCDISKVKGTIFERYVNENKKDYKYLVENKPHSFEVPDEIIENYVTWMIRECSKDRKNKYVLEGVQLYSHGDPNIIKTKPIIFVNASVVKSMIQSHKRNKSYNVSLKDELKELPDMIKYYLSDEKQLKAFKKEVIDEQYIIESSVKNRNPVHIVLVYTGSPFGKAIKTYTKGIYTHAAMSIDNKFDKLYSYNTVNKFNKLGGFSIESIEGYKNTNKDALLCVYTTFISDKQLNKLKKQLDNFINNIDKTKYSILNIFTLLLNKPVELTNDMICSQFVSRMFRSIDINISGKNDSLTTPNDIYRYDKGNKIFKIFEGKISDFNPKDVSKKINRLKSSPITEQQTSIQFDKEGNLIINKPNDIEREYNKSHKLLMTYEKTNNYEAMKEELYKLWFLNIQLEKIIYKQRKNNKEYIDMRARVLNDFTKYLKIVNSNDPEFVFTKEYEKSKYNDTNFVINKSTMKHGINYGKKIFKFLNLPTL